MKSDDSAMSGRACATGRPRDDIGGPMAAVHRRQHAIGARLHRQVQERHQKRHLAWAANQSSSIVGGMRGGVAQPGEPGEVGKLADHRPRPQRCRRAGGAIGVDVLAEQRDLARPAPPAVSPRPKIGPAAANVRRPSYRARPEGAELVAAFLNGQEPEMPCGAAFSGRPSNFGRPGTRVEDAAAAGRPRARVARATSSAGGDRSAVP